MTESRARNRDTVRFRTLNYGHVSTRTDKSQLQQPLLTVCEILSAFSPLENRPHNRCGVRLG